MRVADALRRSAIGIGPERTLGDAAEIMNSTGVGALAVIDNDRLIGIVTDRDLVRRGLARRMPADARVDGVMSTGVITVDADADLHSVFGLFRSHAIRRLPVMRDGRFVGMITIDDLLMNLAADLADLARPISGEVIFAHRDSAYPATVAAPA
jgi:CBS domain-containing protein